MKKLLMFLGVVSMFLLTSCHNLEELPTQECNKTIKPYQQTLTLSADTTKDDLILELKQIGDIEELEAFKQEIQLKKETVLKTVESSQGTLNKTHKKLFDLMSTYIGIPYVWGGSTMKGLDCSGFVQSIYRQLGYKLPRCSYDQALKGEPVSRSELKFGDLLFFDTRNMRTMDDVLSPEQEVIYAKKVVSGVSLNRVSHVGIYIGEGYMLHASSGDGYITYSTLDNTYYKSRFLFAKRIIQ